MKTGRFLCFQVRARTVSQVCNRALAPFSNDPKSKVLASYSFSILDNGGRRRRFSLHVIFLLMVALSRSSKFSFITVVTSIRNHLEPPSTVIIDLVDTAVISKNRSRSFVWKDEAAEMLLIVRFQFPLGQKSGPVHNLRSTFSRTRNLEARTFNG